MKERKREREYERERIVGLFDETREKKKEGNSK
jgi:hypothetical protein